MKYFVQSYYLGRDGWTRRRLPTMHGLELERAKFLCEFFNRYCGGERVRYCVEPSSVEMTA